MRKVVLAIVVGLLSAGAALAEPWAGAGTGGGEQAQNGSQQPAAVQMPAPMPADEGYRVEQVYPSPYIQLPGPVPSRGDGFRRDTNDLFGLTPDEIRQLRKEMDERQRAATDAPSELRSVTIPVSLSPGMAMPSVQVTPGYVTSIVVLDRFGNPWPIKGVSWGNREEYQVEPPPAQKEDAGIPQNIIAVTPLRTIGATSMSILLADKPLPVVIRLVVNRGVTDARADLKIDGLAPGAAPEIRASTVPEQFGDADMVAFLDGVPPKGSTRLTVNSDLVEAWDFKGKMVVRTKGNLVSPRWTGIEHGADDLKVYQTSLVPVVLVLRDGATNMVTVTLPERNVFDGN